MSVECPFQKIDDVLKPLIISDEVVKQIRQVFEEEMHLGLAKDPPQKSSLQMENTYIPELCNGTEKGEFLALDLGGTNFRVILLKLDPSEEPLELVKYYTVPEELRLGKGEPCGCHHIMQSRLIGKKEDEQFLIPISLTLVSQGIVVGLSALGSYSGFCFSFPMIQKALNVGILVTWTKSFNCPDVVGKDAVEMLTTAIKKRGDVNVDICAVVNDTTGTIMKGAYLDPRCAIGLILGTGCNACYLEKVSNIEKWTGKHHGIEEVIIDIEWGAFGDNGILDFIKTEYDKLVDEASLLVNSFTFEKMFSGKYIGELCRHIILKMIKENALFEGNCSKDLESYNSFTAANISDIICDEDDLPITRSILAGLGIDNASVDDAYVIKEICSITSARGALLVSICLASLLDRMQKDYVTIAVDGSLYKRHPFFHDLMTAYISELVPERKFSLILAEDGSGKGAGLVAAVVNRLDVSQLHA